MPRFTLTVALTLAALVASPALADKKDCPPGLAKKDVPCIPPGQAKKMWDEGERVYGDYIVIPRDEWVALQLRDYGDGSRYLRVDDQILRVARDTLIVLGAIRLLEGALN